MNIFFIFYYKFLLTLLLPVGIISNICSWTSTIMIRLEVRQELLNQRVHFAQLLFICIIHGVLLFMVSNIKNWYEIGDFTVQGKNLTFQPKCTFCKKMSLFIDNDYYKGTQIMLVFLIKFELIAVAYLEYSCINELC